MSNPDYGDRLRDYLDRPSDDPSRTWSERMMDALTAWHDVSEDRRMSKHDIEWAVGVLNGPDGIDELGYVWSARSGVVTAVKECSYGEYTEAEAIELAEAIDRKKKLAGKHDIGWAVGVLNDRKYRSTQSGEWRASEDAIVGRGAGLCDRGGNVVYRFLSELEAIAVAKELERIAGRDMPATRALIDALTAMVAYYDKTTPEHMDSMSIGGRRIQPETLRAIVAEWKVES